MARLAGSRNRIEGPDQLAVLRVEGLHAAARAAVPAREARDHHAVVVERRAGDREVLLPALGRDVPNRLARRAIERDEPRVEPTDEDLVAAHRDAAARPAAADRRELGIEVRRVLPEDLAAVDRHRKHVVGAGDHIGDAVVDDRLRLSGVLRAGARAAQSRLPHALELRDVATVDPRERRVALVRVVAAVRRPVRNRSVAPVVAARSARALGRVRSDERREQRQTDRQNDCALHRDGVGAKDCASQRCGLWISSIRLPAGSTAMPITMPVLPNGFGSLADLAAGLLHGVGRRGCVGDVEDQMRNGIVGVRVGMHDHDLRGRVRLRCVDAVAEVEEELRAARCREPIDLFEPERGRVELAECLDVWAADARRVQRDGRLGSERHRERGKRAEREPRDVAHLGDPLLDDRLR